MAPTMDGPANHAPIRRPDRPDRPDRPNAESFDDMHGAAERVALPAGMQVVIDGLTSRPDLNGRVAKILSYDHNADRYGVEFSNEDSMRIKACNLHTLDSIEGKHAVGFDTLGGARCVWCRSPASVAWACKCEAVFCSEACRRTAQSHGHSYLCRKGISYFEPRPGQRFIVVTLPRRRCDTLDTARDYFRKGGAELLPGSALICAHVLAPEGATVPFKTFRFAIKMKCGSAVAANVMHKHVESIGALFNHLVGCTVAVRDSINSPQQRDAKSALPRRAFGITAVAPDGTVEHVEVSYQTPKATRDGVAESVAIEGHVYERGLGMRRPTSTPAVLTPDRVHDFVSGKGSVGLLAVENAPTKPPGAVVGAHATLLTSPPSLTRAVRLCAFDARRESWKVQPVCWFKEGGYKVDKKKPTRTVPATDICIDCVQVPRFPDMWRTTWKDGSSADDVALMAYCTLPLGHRLNHGITIREGGVTRPYALPTVGTVVLPTPPAPFALTELRDDLLRNGIPEVRMETFEGVVPSGTTDDLAVLLRIQMEIVAMPSSTVVLIGRTDANGPIFHLMQLILVHGPAAFTASCTMTSATWLAIRGGDGTDNNLWVAGRSGHALGAARRMILDLSDESECAICLEPLFEDASQPLRCGHAFHAKCMFEVCQSQEGSVQQECAVCKTAFRMTYVTSAEGLRNFEESMK